MIQFFVKRVIGLIFVLIGVTFITFILGYYAPGDPIKVQMGVHFQYDLWVSLRHQAGLDLPWYQQYFNFLVNLARFNFGTSFKFVGQSVWSLLANGVPISTELALWGLAIELLLGIPLGIYSALKANTWIDTTNMGIALVLYALPPFVIAAFGQVLIVWLDGLTGGHWPAANWGNTWQYSWDDIQHKLVPIIVFGAAGFAYFARLSRTTMLEVLRQDYVRTARAKGMREWVVINRHALRNAMIPLVTVIGLAIGLLVTGAFFIESVFNIQGIGHIALGAIGDLDYPVIQATVVLLAVAVVAGNLISDILYSIVDPRIKVA